MKASVNRSMLFFCLQSLVLNRMNTLSKNERLKSAKQIAEVFDAGRKVKAGPLLLFYTYWPRQDVATRFGVSVSKRKFKSAVVRNKIKRHIREAYRLQRLSHLSDLPDSKTYGLFVVYIGNQVPTHATIYKSMGNLLNKLKQHEVTPSDDDKKLT